MRSCLFALGALAFVLALGVVALGLVAAQLQAEGQTIGASGRLTAATSQQEQLVFVTASAIQTLLAPVAAAALLSVAAILTVLAHRWQLRSPELRRREPAR